MYSMRIGLDEGRGVDLTRWHLGKKPSGAGVNPIGKTADEGAPTFVVPTESGSRSPLAAYERLILSLECHSTAKVTDAQPTAGLAGRLIGRTSKPGRPSSKPIRT